MTSTVEEQCDKSGKVKDKYLNISKRKSEIR